MFKPGEIVIVSYALCKEYKITQPYGIVIKKWNNNIYSIRLLELYICDEEESNFNVMGHYEMSVTESDMNHV